MGVIIEIFSWLIITDSPALSLTSTLKYNQYNSSRIPNSYVRFDDGVNKDNSVIRIPTVVGVSDAENNQLQMITNKAEIPVISEMLNTGVSITRV